MTAASGVDWRAEPGDPSVERMWMDGRPTSNTRSGSWQSAGRLALPLDRVTTLAEIPGHRIVRVISVITELSAAAGFTATMKGNDALNTAMENLCTTAALRGANAIIGLNASVFGAAGGITGGPFQGDAVGVLLIGTAVVVEPSEPAE